MASNEELTDKRLTWSPPELYNPTTVNLSSSNRRAILTPNQDYIIKLPESVSVSVSGGIEIIGGRNVILMGGHINVVADYSSGYPDTTNIGFKLQGNTTSGNAPQNLYIEGVRVSSTDPGYLADVFYYQSNKEIANTLTIQNCRVDGLSYGWETNNDGTQGPHADLLQVVGGPRYLRIDRLTALRIGYQGLFLQMNQSEQVGRIAGDPVIKRTNLRMSSGEVPTGMTYPSNGRYAMYLTNTEISRGRKVWCEDLWIAENPATASTNPWYPESGLGSWLMGDVNVGTPPAGDFVSETECGLGYISPGYLNS